MCTCMPAIRLLLLKFFPKLGGSSYKVTVEQSRLYAKSGQSKLPRSRSRNDAEIVSDGLHFERGKDQGMIYENSIAATYNDNDAVSLEQMTVLPTETR
jgi:hypothetical protein